MSYKDASKTTFDPRIIRLAAPGHRPRWIRQTDDMEPIRCFDYNRAILTAFMLGKEYGREGWAAVIAPWDKTHYIQLEEGHPYFENPEGAVAPAPTPVVSGFTQADIDGSYARGWNACRAAIVLPPVR